MRPSLPGAFLGPPLAHRALHDKAEGRAENSAEAIMAARDAGYGIEVDVQLTADGQAVVFHDDDLNRLTGRPGRVRDIALAELTDIPLLSGGRIPSLSECLDLVGGATALLVEIKDQDGRMGPKVGALERAVASDLAGYGGPVAVMSFNPHSVHLMAELAPDVPRGLTTSSWRVASWPGVPAGTRRRLRDIPDFESAGASFISHELRDLDRPRVVGLRAEGIPVLCWTVKSPKDANLASRRADNITFEGFRPALTHRPAKPPKA